MDQIRKMVREIIEEISFLKPHFYDRVDDRLENIKEISGIEELRQEFNKNELKFSDYENLILNEIKSSVRIKINSLKTIRNKESDKLYIYVIAKILLKYKNIIYTPTLISIDDAKLKGNVWYTGAYIDLAKTLLLGKNDSDSEFIKEFKKHYSRKNELDDLKKYVDSGEFESKIEVKRLDGYKTTIDLDEIIHGSKQINPPIPKEKFEIPSKADYRKGTKYTHPKFGTGTILSRNFMEEKDGQKFYNVEIQFDKPYGLKTLRLKNK